MLKRTIILAAGGTGGHVFPAQALAESLIFRGWKVFLVTDNRGEIFANAFPEQVQKLILNINNPWGEGTLKFVLSMWLLMKSFFTVARFVMKKNPSVIVGFGGYPSATSLVVAKIFGIPSAIHEQNTVLGTVNRIFQNRVNLLVFGTTPSKIVKRKSRTIVLGNPIRQSVFNRKNHDYSMLPSSSFCIFVVGGSQGAYFVSAKACQAISLLPEELRRKITVLHQCRQENISEIKKKYESFNIKSETKSFFSDVSLCLNQSNLIISRSGASSLAEFCIFGRPSILIPLPDAIGNHQALNAKVMEEFGASVVLNQKSLTSTILSEHITKILENFELANGMATAAKKLARPNAAINFAKELDKLIQRDV